MLATGKMGNSKKVHCVKSAGFTLLEILVVLVIISIVIGFVSITVDTEPEKLANEGDRLTALMRLASEEAIMNSREYRAVFRAKSYAFEKLSGGEWQEISDGVFRPRELPGNFTFDITSGIPPETLNSGRSEKARILAAIMLLSSGEVTPFELVVKSSSGKELVISNRSGVIELESGHQ